MEKEINELIAIIQSHRDKKEYPGMSFNDEGMYLIIKVQDSNQIYGSYYKKRKK